MAFWDRAETRATPTATMDNPPAWLLNAFGATPSVSGQRVTVQKALGLIPIYAAVSRIAECVGTLPFKVYRQIEDGIRDEARNHPAWRLLNQKPNSATPAGRFWSTVSVHVLLWGNAYVRKVGRGAGMELFVLPPDQVRVKWWPNLGEKTFVWQPAELGQVEQEFDETEVLHIMGLSVDGVVGMSVIDQCRAGLGSALARDEFEGTFYRRGTVLSGLVQMDGRIKSDSALQRLAESIKALFAGSSKAHGVPVFEDGAKWVQTSSPLRDLQFVESQNMTRGDIAVLFGLPPNYLGASSGDGLTYATVEMNQTHFALHAIAPLTNTIAEAVSQDPAILPQNIFDAEFVLEGMLRSDSAGRADYYEKLVNLKVMAPSEVRAKENLGPFTKALEDELKPPAPPPPPQQLMLDAPMDGASPNGNGNGAMPANSRS